MTGQEPTTAHRAAPGAPMASADWDARYRDADLVWGARANRFVSEYTADLTPGRAVDLACGEGRNALDLAGRGWQVTGVDFSGVALDKARALERALEQEADAWSPVQWVQADVTEYRPEWVDLALLVYLHLPRRAWLAALERAVGALAPGGRILVVGHHTRNITDGVGGPQDPAILYTPQDVVEALQRMAPDLIVRASREPRRDVPGADGAAIDTVVLAQRR